MEIFAIQCTTCKARLKVQDEAAIGQILSCPKCQSMVLIEPPAEWQSQAAVAAAAANLVPTPPPLPPTIPSLDDLQPQSVWREWWVYAAGIAAGVVLGGGIWLIMAASQGDSAPVEATPVAIVEVTEEPTQSPLVEAPEKVEPTPDKPAPPVATTNDIPHELTPAATEPEAPAITEDQSVAPENNAADANNNVALTTTEPAAVEIEMAAEATKPAEVTPEPPAEAPAAKPIAETPTGDSPEVASNASLTPPSPVPADNLATETFGPTHDEVTMRLEERVSRIAFKEVPLRQFLAFLSDFSGLKFSVDSQSFAANKKPPLKVTVRSTDESVKDVLNAALQNSGARYEIRNGTVVIFMAPVQ